MRVGLDLRGVPDPAQRVDLAMEADVLGLWAVLLGGAPGTEATEGAAIATRTESVQLALWMSTVGAHPLTLAEELAIVDHLSGRRIVGVIDGDAAQIAHVRTLLWGGMVDGVALAPPPAQTEPTIWAPHEVHRVDLSGDLSLDRATIDRHRERGIRFLFVSWPGDPAVLARHLVTRAATPEFPQLVADLADQIAPLPRSRS